MGTFRYTLLVSFLILAFVTAGAGDVIRSGSLQASSDGVSITLRWVSEDESNVAAYDVQRAVPNGTFQTIATIPAKGASLYEYVDHSAFMKATSLYQYRIQIIAAQGNNPPPSVSVTVSHSVSGVRRTWGSIKAMFR